MGSLLRFKNMDSVKNKKPKLVYSPNNTTTVDFKNVTDASVGYFYNDSTIFKKIQKSLKSKKTSNGL